MLVPSCKKNGDHIAYFYPFVYLCNINIFITIILKLNIKDNCMRLHQINKQKEKYILDESIENLYGKMVNEAKYIEERMENKRPKLVVEKEIKEFIDKYYEIVPIIRTILAFDKASKKTDPDRPSMMGIGKLLHSNEEETRKELHHFKEKVIDANDKLKANYQYFKSSIQRTLERNEAYKGAGFIHEVLEMDDVVKSQIDSFYDRNTKDAKSVSECIIEMIEANYDSEELNEGRKMEPDQYYMVVELSLYDNNKSEKVPHKNFKNVLVTNAKSQAQARQKLKASANKSLRELNKKLKDRGMCCKYRKDNWFRENTVYKGYDSMKKKNIKSLSGSDSVSTGIYLLGGMCGHGTVGSVPEMAPNRYAIHSSKSSVTRYLNKHSPMED